jgi:transposase
MDEITLRKQAVQLYLNGAHKTDIARQLGKSWFWVMYWTKRYQPDDPEGSLHNRSSAPKQPHRSWSEAIRQLVLASRKARQAGEPPGYQYALIGAEAIHYELQELGISPVPPVRTIHSWLKQADQVTQTTSQPGRELATKPYPAPLSQAVNDLHQFDLKGPFYLSGSAQKHYLGALRDTVSKRVALAVFQDKQMETLMDFLLAAWRKLGLPNVLQMDNGLEFRGSNRYPRSPGKLLRMALDLGVEPLFIPPHEPWRNGVSENLNGLVDRIFLKRETFEDFDQLQGRTQAVETSINTTHRLPALHGQTPSEFAQKAGVRRLPEGYDWRKRDLRLVKGKVSFVRLVRKSGRITLCANDKFEIGTQYQWQYVLATVNVEIQKLDIFFQGQLIKSFDYC